MPVKPAVTAAQLEQILAKIDALPTLSPIALQLLQLSANDDATIRQIVSAIESDAALTSRVLAMTRKAEIGLPSEAVLTVDRAVVLLGFEAVRTCILGAHLYELMASPSVRALDQRTAGPKNSTDDPTPIDRIELWKHCLSTACCAELIATAHQRSGLRVRPDEAFVCGLLHDLGKVALDRMLPRAYAKIAHVANERQASIADVEQAVLGLDHHQAGARLADRWGLPEPLRDAIALHGTPYETLPETPHTQMIGLVTVADALARSLHIGWSGDHARFDINQLCEERGLNADRTLSIGPAVYDRVRKRAAELGLDPVIGTELEIDSLRMANKQLGAMRNECNRNRKLAARRGRAVEGLNDFWEASHAARTLDSTLGAVASSAIDLFGPGGCALITQTEPGAAWSVRIYDGTGTAPTAAGIATEHLSQAGAAFEQLTEPVLLRELIEDESTAAEVFGALGDMDVNRTLCVPLCTAGGAVAGLLHSRVRSQSALRNDAARAMLGGWTSAVATACRTRLAHDERAARDTARADADNAQNTLRNAKDALAASSLIREAVDEMRDPVSIVAGQAKLLDQRTSDPGLRGAVRSIKNAGWTLGRYLDAIRFFGRTLEPESETCDLPDMLAITVRDLRAARQSRDAATPPVNFIIQGPVPPVHLDRGMLTLAISEILDNAMDAGPRGSIQMRVQSNTEEDRLKVSITDQGRGMAPAVLRRAFDPFFAAKGDGMSTGLGLTKAKRLVEILGGTLQIDSKPEQGCRVTLEFTDWHGGAETDSTVDTANAERTHARAA